MLLKLGHCPTTVLLSSKDKARELLNHFSNMKRDCSYPLPNTWKNLVKPMANEILTV